MDKMSLCSLIREYNDDHADLLNKFNEQIISCNKIG
jgi:hypothetical protein